MNLIKSLAVVATVAVTIASSALLADAARTTEKNKAVYYAEWKKSGKIKDKITKTYTVKNNKYMIQNNCKKERII